MQPYKDLVYILIVILIREEMCPDISGHGGMEEQQSNIKEKAETGKDFKTSVEAGS